MCGEHRILLLTSPVRRIVLGIPFVVACDVAYNPCGRPPRTRLITRTYFYHLNWESLTPPFRRPYTAITRVLGKAAPLRSRQTLLRILSLRRFFEKLGKISRFRPRPTILEHLPWATRTRDATPPPGPLLPGRCVGRRNETTYQSQRGESSSRTQRFTFPGRVGAKIGAHRPLIDRVVSLTRTHRSCPIVNVPFPPYTTNGLTP